MSTAKGVVELPAPFYFDPEAIPFGPGIYGSSSNEQVQASNWTENISDYINQIPIAA